MADEANRRRAWRYWLQQVHLWAGLILCVPLTVIGVTGSILVYGHDIEHLLADEPRAMATGAVASVGAIVAAAQAAAPPGMRPVAIRMPTVPGDPAAVRLARPRSGPVGGSPFAGSVPVLVDPVSLQILGNPGAAPGWLRGMHNLHGNLLIAGRDGRVVVGWLGIIMLVLGVSGLILWWPQAGKWAAAFTVKRGARGVRLHRDLHGAVGIWSLVVFIVVSFSGVYLAFPQQTGAMIGAAFPSRDLRAAATAIRVEPVNGAASIDIDRAIVLARAAVAGSEVRTAFLPLRPDQPIRINLVRANHAAGAPMVTAFIDSWAGRVIEVHDPQTFTVGEAIMAWQRALHYGQGLGEVYKFAVFLSGLVIPLFAITGCAMWLLKRRSRRAAMRRKPA